MDHMNSDASDRRPVPLRSLAWVQALAAWLAKIGVSPNAISLAGLAVAVLAAWLWAMTESHPGPGRLLWLAGVALMALRVLANMLDGLVAVEWGRATKVGLLYNDVPDRLADSALLIGMGCAQGGDLVWGFAATSAALLVTYTRLIGRAAGAPSDFSGPMDKGGRMKVLVLAALFMGLAPATWIEALAGLAAPATLALAIVCAGGVYTAGRRLVRAGRYLRQER